MPGFDGGGGGGEGVAAAEEEEEQPQPPTTCSDLPDDVLRALLSHLPTAALPGAAAVCRRWRRVLLDPTKPVWADAFSREWGGLGVGPGSWHILVLPSTER